MLVFGSLFCSPQKMSQNEALQGGVDMQSVHAGACFVRVGRCCLGSILGSILWLFWEPRAALYSFWGDFCSQTCNLGVPFSQRINVLLYYVVLLQQKTRKQ